MVKAMPVVIVESGGIPVSNLGDHGATPLTVIADGALPITLVESGGLPVTLLDEDGDLYSPGPVIRLSAFVVAENAANGTTIGTISTTGTPGDWGTSTYTVTADPDSKFTITGTALKKNATMNYEATTSHSVTITDTPSGPYDPIARAFAISVTNVAPVLSSATDAVTSDTTADIGVDTTESNGTIYWVVTRSLTPPTASQIIAGKDATGATASRSGTIAVASTGTKTASVTGLTPNIDDYCAHFVHVETSGTQSNVASGDGFSTSIRIELSATTIAEDATNGTEIGELSVVGGNGVYTFTVTDDPDGVFDITGGSLDKDGTLDYEAATSHQVTIEADNGIDTPLTRTFTITVTNVAPVLSNATDTKTGQTTADIAVDTTESNGILYWVVSTSSTAPTAAQVKTGKMHTGASAAASGSAAVSASGTQATIGVTGLTAATAYTAHFMHEETSGTQSNVASGNGFTTDGAASWQTAWSKTFNAESNDHQQQSLRVVIAAADISLGGGTIRLTFTAHSSLTTAITRAYIVERSGTSDDGTTTPTQITFDTGSDGFSISGGATKVSDTLTFTLDEAKDYLVNIDLGIGQNAAREVASGSTYYKTADGTTAANQAFTSEGSAGTTYLVSKIEVFA